MLTRPVAIADVALICRHRETVFREAGCPEDDLTAMAAPFRRWLAKHLDQGSYFGFVTEQDGVPVASVGLMEIDWPPHPAHPDDARRGYVLNLLVGPAWRGRGIARGLMETSERSFAERGVAYAILHATAAGRPLYERLGWAPTTEMAKSLS